jgi:AraC-like DNA-binding protein
MNTLFDCSQVDATRGFGYWREVIHDLFYRLDCLPQRHDVPRFDGAIRTAVQGGVRISRIASDGQRVVRTRAQVQGGDGDELGLLLQTRGETRMSQRDHQCRLEPGDLAVFDNGQPYVLDMPGAYEVICVQIPREVLGQRARSLERNLAVTIPASQPTTALLGAYVGGLCEHLSDIAPPFAHEHLRHLVELTGLHLAQQGPSTDAAGEAASRPLAWRVERCIGERLGDPALSPASIARDCGISVRCLHRLFQAEGSTTMQFVKRARLERCREQLPGARARGLTVESIALANGFVDMPHFRRAFREAFGIAPSELSLSASGAARTTRA